MLPIGICMAGVAGAIQTNNFILILIALVAATVVSLRYLHSVYARRSFLDQTPTSKLRSASQGFTEVTGVAAYCSEMVNDPNMLTPNSQISPFSETPCIWWRLNIYKDSSNRFSIRRSVFSNAFLSFLLNREKLVSSENSNTPVAIRDNTGCVIFFPCDAHLDCFEHERVTIDGLIYVEEIIISNIFFE